MWERFRLPRAVRLQSVTVVQNIHRRDGVLESDPEAATRVHPNEHKCLQIFHTYDDDDKKFRDSQRHCGQFVPLCFIVFETVELTRGGFWRGPGGPRPNWEKENNIPAAFVLVARLCIC